MPKTSSDLPPIESLTYEQALSELEALVSALESEPQSLAESLAMYERGQALARHCTGLLEQADLRVQALTSTGISDFIPQD